MDEFFDEKSKLEKEDIFQSPSGKYTLVVNYYDNGEGYWDYSSGRVYMTESMKKENKKAWILKAFVRRNYPSFWHCFIEKDDDEFILCGADYQGYSVIKGSNGERLDYLYPNAVWGGAGFCWIDCEQVDENKIEVLGCYWGADYEVVEYDIGNIFSLPYPEISRRFDE